MLPMIIAEKKRSVKPFSKKAEKIFDLQLPTKKAGK